MNLLDLLQSVRHLQKLPIARNVFPIHSDILLDWQVLQQNQINHQEHNPIIDFSSAHTKTTQIDRSKKETQNKIIKYTDIKMEENIDSVVAVVQRNSIGKH